MSTTLCHYYDNRGTTRTTTRHNSITPRNNTSQNCRLELININKMKDPYSIYDDESSSSHYFLVPACDPKHFKRAFEELNGKQHTTIEGSSHQNGYINERTIRRTQRTTCNQQQQKTIINNSLHTNKFNRAPPPPPKTKNFPDCSSGEDDYCLIKADTKTTFQPSRTCTLSSANTREKKHQYVKRENIPEFPTLVKYDDITKTNECCLKTINKNRCLNADRYIDVCTCMICVRSVSYNYTGDDDGEFIEPCSCQGSKKGIIGRYMCMGLMAIFLPCMLCYLPAKACCGSRKSQKHKHFTDDTHVHYQSNNNKPL